MPVPDILKTLTDEERPRCPPLSPREIAEALERGRQEAEASRLSGVQIPNPGRRYR